MFASLSAHQLPPLLGRAGWRLRYAPMEVELISASVLDRVPGWHVVEAYALTATRHGGRLLGAHERAHSIAVDIERALSPQPPVFCHNDLLNANFIDDGVSIRIVDWERAGMGDRFFDFGNFAVNHQLTEDDEASLLMAYFGRVAGAHHARPRLMRLMSDYREAMWGVLQQMISALDFDFSAYASKHFDRLLAGAADR